MRVDTSSLLLLAALPSFVSANPIGSSTNQARAVKQQLLAKRIGCTGPSKYPNGRVGTQKHNCNYCGAATWEDAGVYACPTDLPLTHDCFVLAKEFDTFKTGIAWEVTQEEKQLMYHESCTLVAYAEPYVDHNSIAREATAIFGVDDAYDLIRSIIASYAKPHTGQLPVIVTPPTKYAQFVSAAVGVGCDNVLSGYVNDIKVHFMLRKSPGWEYPKDLVLDPGNQDKEKKCHRPNPQKKKGNGGKGGHH